MGKKLDERLNIFSSNSLSVQGTNDVPMPEDLKEGLKSWYTGKGISMELLRKYYGVGKSLIISPADRPRGYFAT